MMIAPILLGVLALAGAQQVHRQSSELDSWNSWSSEYPEIRSPRISERVFRDNKEYRYMYDGQILTGLPETADQYSGLRIRAIVTVQLRSGVDVLKIEKATLGRLNERSIDGPLEMQPAQDFEEITGEEAKEWNTALTKPIRFQYDDNTGAVSDLISLETDPFWSVNIKRAILSTFNLKLKSQSAEILSHPRFAGLGRQQSQQKLQDEGTEYFSVMEDGIGGECEAIYLVQSLPARDVARVASAARTSVAEVLNVTKSWNYENCKSRPILLESLNSGSKCLGKETGESAGCSSSSSSDSKKDNIINSASHTRYTLAGNADDFLIQSAVTESVHKFFPYSDKAGSITAYVNATLRLIYAGEWASQYTMPTGQGVSLRGLSQLLPNDQDNQFSRQSFLQASDRTARFMESTSEWPNVAAKKTIIKALLERLVEDLADDEVEPESANLVLQMSVILGYATSEEIAEIHREIKGLARQSVEQDQIENLWFDVLALTGTKPAVLYIKREIQQQNLKGERAAQLLNTLAFSIGKPDQDIVQEMITLCKDPAVTQHSGMKKACWLSVGTLAHISCVEDAETTTTVQNTIVKNGNAKCTAAWRQRLVMELLARVKTSKNAEDRILALKTIGNTGFAEAAQDLKAIFVGDSESTIMRTNALYALNRIASSEPELVQAMVLPVFHDQTNPFQVRIAAFDVAIEAEADLPDLQLIAESLHKEKSKQVGSYVWSKLNTLANATHPCFEKLSDNAALALEFGTPFNTGFSYSKAIHIDGYSENLELGGFAEIETIGDASSVIPREVAVRLNAHVMGLSHDLVEAGIETTGVSDLIKKFAMSRGNGGNAWAQLFGDYDDSEDEQDEEQSRRGRQAGRASGSQSARKSFKQRPEFDEFDRLLGLVDRKDEEIEASAYLKIFGHEVRFMTLSPKAILRAISEAYLQPSELARLAQGSLSIDHRKALMAADAELTIPTELGLPLTVELKAPVVISAKGTIGLKTQPALSSLASLMKMPQSLTVDSDVKISAATEIHGKMSVWAAYLKIGAGIRAQISTVLPLDGQVTVDLKSGKIETTIDLPQEPLELINVQIMPITYTKSVPKTLVPHQPDRKDTRDQDWNQNPVQYNQQPLENEQPTEYFRFKSDLTENPFMLTQNGRPSTKYYEGLAVPVLDVKEVATFDVLKTKTVNMRVGHPAAGFVLNVDGQWQMAHGVPNVPFLPVGGKNKVTVTLLPAQKGIKSVSAALHFRQEEALSSARPSWNKLFDKMENYDSANMLTRLGSDLPAAFSKDDKSGYSAQLVIKGHTGSQQDVAMQGVLTWVRGMDGKFVKVAAELSSLHQQMPYQVCINGHTQYPEEYDSWNLSPATNKPVTGQWEFAAGRSCRASDATKIKATFTADKSTEQLNNEQNDLYSVRGSVIPEIHSKPIEPMAYALKGVWQECDDDRKQGARWSPACETVKDLYSQLMQMKIDIEYQNVPRGLKVLLDKAEQMTHALFQWNSDVDNVDIRNAPNHVTVWANFSGVQDTFDLIYSTPNKDAKLIGLPVPYPLGPLEADDEPLNFWEALLNEDLDDVCSVSGNRINTLDSAKLNIGQSRCWSLLAKDTSREELWSVLFAQAGSRSADGKKVIVFIGENKIELEPATSFASARQLRSSGDVMLKINGRAMQLNEEKEAIQVDQDIEVSLETDGDATAPYVAISAEEYGLELWYDGHNVALKPTHWLRNQVAGLCGNDNGEEWDDMLLPSGQRAQTVEDLFRGFTVQKDGCEAEQSAELGSARLSQYPYARDQEECGKLKTIVKRRQGKVCFSVEPVEQCPAGCSGADDEDSSEERVPMQRVEFHCVPENSSKAQTLLRDAQSRVLTELAVKPVNDYFAVARAKLGCGGRAAQGNGNSIRRNMQQRALRV